MSGLLQHRWIGLIRRLLRLAPALFLAACASTAAAPRAGPAPPADETVYLIAGGWHTEIGLSRAAAHDLPDVLAAQFADARYLVFGWGERDYYMAPNPGLGDVLRALAPGPAVTLVIPLAAPPTQVFGAGNVLALPVSEAGLARLSAFLSASIAKDRGGEPERIAPGPDPGSVFYAATGTYDLAHNCNTWTAEALEAAGLPVSAAGVVFAGQVLRQAEPLAPGGS